MRRYILISIKPKYSNMILRGKKSIELRKSAPKVKKGDYMIIYSTSPVKSIVAITKINRIIEKSPVEMWNEFSSDLGVSKLDFNRYYQDREKAVGIEIGDVININPISLEKMRLLIPDFQPPQSYCYVDYYKFSNVLDDIFTKDC